MRKIETPEEKYRTMTEQPIPKLISRLAVPTIISMLITNIYNMADTFFVGKLGTSATAAVGVVFPLMSVIQTFGFFLRARLRGKLHIQGHGKSKRWKTRSRWRLRASAPLFFSVSY